jgi:hypothetical protein
LIAALASIAFELSEERFALLLRSKNFLSLFSSTSLSPHRFDCLSRLARGLQRSLVRLGTKYSPLRHFRSPID